MKKANTRGNSNKKKSIPKKGNVAISINMTESDFEDNIMELNLKKPKTCFNFYIAEQKVKTKSQAAIPELTKEYSEKYKSLTAKEKERFLQMQKEDEERYKTHLEVAKTYLLKKPLRENSSAFSIFCDSYVAEAIERGEDRIEARVVAREKWANMGRDQKAKWEEKKGEVKDVYADLKKFKKGKVGGYSLFVRDKILSDKIGFADAADLWKKAKSNIKEKYEELAAEYNEENQRKRDLWEIANGVKPRRPMGPFNFFIMEMANEGKFSNVKNVLQVAHDLWKKTSTEDKEKYIKIARKAALIHAIKKREFINMHRKKVSKPLSAFNLYVKENGYKAENEEIPQGQYFTFFLEKWNNESDATRKKYKKKADELKKQHEVKKGELDNKIWDAPKRNPSAYNLYLRDRMSELSSSKSDTVDKFKSIAEEWNSLSDQKKNIFENEAAKLKEIYIMNQKEYDKNGYYTLDGDMNYYRKPREGSDRLDLTQSEVKVVKPRGRPPSNTTKSSRSKSNMKEKNITSKKSNMSSTSKGKGMKGRTSRSKKK